jgi:phage-related minor tail protein
MDPMQASNGVTELRRGLEDLTALGETFGRTMRAAFVSAAADGRKLSDVLRSLMLSLSRQTLSAALKPLEGLFGGLAASILPSARGNIVSSGRIVPFASGGIVDSPTLFPLRSGAGLMGESGAEAIMPLARGSDGRLGVRAASSRPVNVTVNISTPDAESFKRSQSQVSAAMLRAIERGGRNL